MASIGSASFNILNFQSGDKDPGMQSRDVSREGVNGKAFLLTGKRAGTTTYTSEKDLSSASNLKSEIATYKNAQGTIQSLTDDHNNAYTVFVNAVRITEEKVVARYSGGSGGTHLLRAEWEVTFL